MSRVIRRRWPGDPRTPSRWGRLACEYEAYVPDKLVGRRLTLDGDVAADVADAESAIARLNVEASALADTEALARLLLRAESVASSPPRVLPPISLVLATWAKDYIDGLTATRYRSPATGKAAQVGLNLWVGRFAGACRRAVDDAAAFEDRVQQIGADWRGRLDRVRANSATDLLLTSLPGAPVLTVSGAAELIGRSYLQANEAVQRLLSAGVLSQVTVGRRNRAFEAPAVIDAFTDLERQLASPAADTHSSPSARRVPSRRPNPSDDGQISRHTMTT